MSSELTDRLVEIGVVGRPHGLTGEVRFFLHNSDSFSLDSGESVLLEIDDAVTEHRIQTVRRTPKYGILRLQAVETREAAEKLKGAKLCVRRSSLPQPEPGEFYVCDLIGAAAWDGPVRLGLVTASRRAGGVEVVQIMGDQEEIEVPLVEDFVEALDLDLGRLVLRNTDVLPRTRISKR